MWRDYTWRAYSRVKDRFTGLEGNSVSERVAGLDSERLEGIEEVKEILQGFEEGKALELGSGMNIDLPRLLPSDIDLVQLEIDREALKHLDRNKKWYNLLKNEDISSSPIQGDIEKLPFQKNSFDLVYAVSSLHPTSNLPSYNREIDRVLKDGGMAIIFPKISIYPEIKGADNYSEKINGVVEGTAEGPTTHDEITDSIDPHEFDKLDIEKEYFEKMMSRISESEIYGDFVVLRY